MEKVNPLMDAESAAANEAADAVSNAALNAASRAAAWETADAELRLLGRIAAGAARELDGSLATTEAILALLETAPADAELRERARRSVAHARRIVGSLVARIHGVPAELEQIELGALVHHALLLAAPSIPSTITVRTDIASRLRPVLGAAGELEQLVLTLVLNAADAMPSGGEIAVRVQPSSTGAVYLEVSDTGEGPPAVGDVPSAASTTAFRGELGIGIVRRVIARHGGAFRLTQRIERRGTVAWVLLPTQ